MDSYKTVEYYWQYFKSTVLNNYYYYFPPKPQQVVFLMLEAPIESAGNDITIVTDDLGNSVFLG